MDNSLVKEAENIINEYIRENKLAMAKERQGKRDRRLIVNRVFTNTLINILLLAAVAFLIFAISKIF